MCSAHRDEAMRERVVNAAASFDGIRRWVWCCSVEKILKDEHSSLGNLTIHSERRFSTFVPHEKMFVDWVRTTPCFFQMEGMGAKGTRFLKILQAEPYVLRAGDGGKG